MKLAIIGSRGFSDQELVEKTFKRYFCHFRHDSTFEGWETDVKEIISGGATGADTCASQLSKDWGLKLTEFIPDWDKHGKKAGFLRNEDIVREANIVLAFWLNESRGTGHSLSIAKRLKKPTLIIYP